MNKLRTLFLLSLCITLQAQASHEESHGNKKTNRDETVEESHGNKRRKIDHQNNFTNFNDEQKAVYEWNFPPYTSKELAYQIDRYAKAKITEYNGQLSMVSSEVSLSNGSREFNFKVIPIHDSQKAIDYSKQVISINCSRKDSNSVAGFNSAYQGKYDHVYSHEYVLYSRSLRSHPLQFLSRSATNQIMTDCDLSIPELEQRALAQYDGQDTSQRDFRYIE